MSLKKPLLWSAVCTAIVLTVSTGIVSGQKRQSQANGQNDTPFVVAGHEWASKKAFVEHGGRCSTRNVGPDEEREIDQIVATSSTAGKAAIRSRT